MFLSTIFFLLLCLFFCRKPPTNRRAEPPTASVRQWRLDDENIPLEASSLRHEADYQYKQGRQAVERRDLRAARMHRAEAQRLDEKACEIIYAAKNQSRLPNEIDLHGLLAREGKVKVASAVDRAKALGYSEMRVIVGKGNHSNDGLAQLRPKITTYIAEELGLSVRRDSRNAGVLVVSL